MVHLGYGQHLTYSPPSRCVIRILSLSPIPHHHRPVISSYRIVSSSTSMPTMLSNLSFGRSAKYPPDCRPVRRSKDHISTPSSPLVLSRDTESETHAHCSLRQLLVIQQWFIGLFPFGSFPAIADLFMGSQLSFLTLIHLGQVCCPFMIPGHQR